MLAPRTEVAGGARYPGRIPVGNLTLPYCTRVWIQRFVRFANEVKLIQIHTVDTGGKPCGADGGLMKLLCPQCLSQAYALGVSLPISITVLFK